MNETTNAPSRNRSSITIDDLVDKQADYELGFWLNGVGISCIGLLGILGNIASIRVLSHRKMRSSVNFILIALASSDLVLITTSILLFGWRTIYPYNGNWKDYYLVYMPNLTGFLFPLAIIAQTVSIYMTFLISLERFVAVCHPLKVKSFCTQARTKLSIIVIVVLSIVYNLPRIFETSLMQSNDEDYGVFYYVAASELRKNHLYITIYIHWMYFLFMNLIPLGCITFFNVMIYLQVQVVNRSRVKLTSKEMNEIKLTTMLFCVVIAFLSCNILAVVTNILEAYNIHNDRLTTVSNFLVTLNSSINFIIYVLLVKKFREILITQLKSLVGIEESKNMTRISTTRYTQQTQVSDSDSEQTKNEKL